MANPTAPSGAADTLHEALPELVEAYKHLDQAQRHLLAARKAGHWGLKASESAIEAEHLICTATNNVVALQILCRDVQKGSAL